MLREEGSARSLMESTQKLELAKWLNLIEGKVLKAISKGNNPCYVEKVPDWVVNNLKNIHPDWKVIPYGPEKYETGKIEISW